jgi:hypothetical protein
MVDDLEMEIMRHHRQFRQLRQLPSPGTTVDITNGQLKLLPRDHPGVIARTNIFSDDDSYERSIASGVQS